MNAPGAALDAARVRTVLLLGHEHHGAPDEVWPIVDQVVSIPMVGMGASLNVAVAGSLVLPRRPGVTQGGFTKRWPPYSETTRKLPAFSDFRVVAGRWIPT